MSDRGRELPRAVQTAIAAMPEHSYGVNRVSLTLKDGRVVSDVYVGWAIDVLRVGERSDIPFDPADVIAAEHQP